jgi:Cof subfamily protein (haloacid dehalogenase superfamily)
MEKKLLFIDIDGTLFDNKQDKVHESTLEALEQLKQNKDIYVCIASGRSSQLANEVLDRYPMYFDGYVLVNGQIVMLNDVIIYKNPLKQAFIKEFIAECEKCDVPYGLVSNSLSIVSDHHPKVVQSFREFKMALPEIAQKKDYSDEFYQGLFFDMRYFDHFVNKFKDEVVFLAWHQNEGADIIPKGSSKAIGMEVLRKKLKIKRENIYAVGDSTNDIEMIEYAHIGIAMGNGKEELKQVADYVTEAIDQDGLMKALKKYQLI